jgi:hypothetical protein
MKSVLYHFLAHLLHIYFFYKFIIESIKLTCRGLYKFNGEFT